MTFAILFEIFMLGIALSMDAFAVAVTFGLTYSDINKRKSIFIASVFGVMQALMPLLGFFLVEIITLLVGDNLGLKAGIIMSDIVSWVAFILLIIIGINMIKEAIEDMKNKSVSKTMKVFSIKEVLYYGFATAIDALGTGVALHSGLSTNSTIWLHVLIIMITTFIISLIGLFLGEKIEKLFKGKFEITGIIGGSILLILAFSIILSHYQLI